SGRWAVFTPAGLIFSIWRRMPHFRSYSQQDAQEFLSCLLDALHEEQKRGGVPKGVVATSSLLIPLAAPTSQVPNLGRAMSGAAHSALSGVLSSAPSRSLLSNGVTAGGATGGRSPVLAALQPAQGGGAVALLTPPHQSAPTLDITSPTSARGEAEAFVRPLHSVASSSSLAENTVDEIPQPRELKLMTDDVPACSSTPTPLLSPAHAVPSPVSARPHPSRARSSAAAASGTPAAAAVTAPAAAGSSSMPPRASSLSLESLPRFPQTTFVGDTFTGSTCTTVKCSKCGTKSSRVEPFLCLSVDIEGLDKKEPAPAVAALRTRDGHQSLLSCLAKMCEPVTLQGDSAYYCERCDAKVAAVRRMQLHQLPHALLFHVQRAQWTSRAREKLQNFVAFPPHLAADELADAGLLSDEALATLRLAAEEHMSPQSATSGSSSSSDSSASSDGSGVAYTLKAVVMHVGRGIDVGHYKAFCYDDERDTWLLYDDTRVHVTMEGEVLRAQAYLLMYERDGPLPPGTE
ncbi:hypothetical protein EON66_06590, partial [archaeon]